MSIHNMSNLKTCGNSPLLGKSRQVRPVGKANLLDLYVPGSAHRMTTILSEEMHGMSRFPNYRLMTLSAATSQTNSPSR